MSTTPALNEPYEQLVNELARGAEVDVQLMLTVLAASGKSVLELERDVDAAAGDSPGDPQRGVTE
ncbi:hypothetical protein VT84_05120 [Gemmata sp. SH-PL17]|uniref:hypothetical protein n=1 Tax=Gemmata sp. SH-PL17 TaxID=1630693 RepID=UPI00078C3E47|nr:hypothetical protein [Gemmata sp. SH-PL17]AMV23771.1 hypothetical protein VT84_05120 [Gemmata sp. SH-PL17]